MKAKGEDPNQSTKMNYLTWVSINVPVGIMNFLINAFYIFCMVRPLHRERIKQPLKLLLASLIISTIVYLMVIFGALFSEGKSENKWITQISLLISVCCLSSSVSSSVWLNFFYYMQIVPAQSALFIWMKKNIKPIILCILFVEHLYSCVDVTVALLDSNLDVFGFNNTFSVDYTYVYLPVRNFLENPVDKYLILISLQKSHFYFSFIVMMASSGATVVYLCRHMRHMVANGQSLSCPTFSSQVRVTITGILQGVLYLSFAVWREYAFVTRHIHSAFMSPYIRSTVIGFYMSGTTFNLGAGQAVFRQRAADVWNRAAQWCKVLTTQQPEKRSRMVVKNLSSTSAGMQIKCELESVIQSR